MNPRILGFISANHGMVSNVIDSLIASSMQVAYALAGARGKSPSEPDFVALLVAQAAPQFGAALASMFSPAGVQLKITSVFCHGRPEVQHAAGTCELGDLLLAHFHTDSSGNTERKSLLLQAKMSASTIHTLGTGDRIQLGLYTGWGSFKYTRTSGLSGQRRSVTPYQSHPGAQYLLIDSSGPNNPSSGILGLPNTFPMGTAPSQVNLVLQRSLGATLTELMMGNDGRRFCAQHLAIKDWDQVVWDLILHGTRAAFSRRRVGISQRPRGVDSIVTLAARQASYTSGDPIVGSEIEPLLSTGSNVNGDSPEYISDDDEGRGVSLVLIETREPG
jgi:hypothetical protein